MSRPRFLADEDLRGSIVRALRRHFPEIEVTTVVEQGLTAASDREVLAFAWQHRWLLVSHDVSTMRSYAEERIAEGEGCHGLFLVPQRCDIRLTVECLRLIGSASEFEEWRSTVAFIPF